MIRANTSTIEKKNQIKILKLYKKKQKAEYLKYREWGRQEG